MEPMKPMKPMEPMKPMAPMKGTEPWWPGALGKPSTTGSQNDMRYAVFPDKHRLLVETKGKTKTYDTGDHRISGVAQQDSGAQSLSFTSQDGPVAISALSEVD